MGRDVDIGQDVPQEAVPNVMAGIDVSRTIKGLTFGESWLKDATTLGIFTGDRIQAKRTCRSVSAEY